MDDGLRAELLRRVETDQVARKALDPEAMREADGENLPWLKDVIAEHGWPGASLVGTDGAHAAWLLAHHADADPAFQRQCLDLLTAAVEAGEATDARARLPDRPGAARRGQAPGVRHPGDPPGRRVVPRDLRDPDGVDERRAAAGLEPFAEYLGRFGDHRVPTARLKCPGCDAWAPFEPPEGDEPVTVTCPECALETTMRLKR